ncbi:MAG: hypothetical protein IKJ37_07290, partial [Kiritimatiellae bacterium]|nr:hypothetical protein [Kiritimatiellia bacterium]
FGHAAHAFRTWGVLKSSWGVLVLVMGRFASIPGGAASSLPDSPPPHPYNGQPARRPFMGIGTPKNKRKHSINRLSNYSFLTYLTF